MLTTRLNGPKVSIILPTYGRSAYLKEAIESIFNQSFGNFKIILVDNAFTDTTDQVIGAFDNLRIRHFIKISTPPI